MTRARFRGAVGEWLICALIFTVTHATIRAAEAKWTVHEWGTFTSLQDEDGRAIGGINTDDEPVPGFVHRLRYFMLLSPTEVPGIFFQGAPSCHPDVTMRLETPVIYFHPPEPANEIRSVDVSVNFRGGWLTEFYPDAAANVDGAEATSFRFDNLNARTVSSLQWNGLKVGGNWKLTNTSAHVWTSPRAVNAASALTTHNEAEKFLFYRGVAHIDAPLRVSRNGSQLVLRSNLKPTPEIDSLKLGALWLVDIEANGKLAYRTLPGVTLSSSEKPLAQTPADFAPRDYSRENLAKLRSALRDALVADGLFGDEAEALLNTWELSYFKSAGLRVFFLVPRAWTDHYLPLEVSVPAETKRVMVGRIELVTPEQRHTLRDMAAFSADTISADMKEIHKRYYDHFARAGSTDSEVWEQIQRGAKPLTTTMKVPNTYRAYLSLGRFRNALILDEQKRHPSPSLAKFIETYRLEPQSLVTR